MARPAFKPTASQRQTVATAAACGRNHEAIAQALGMSPNTLRKHFPDELQLGWAIRQMEVLDALFLQAKRGNVSAIKRALALMDRVDREQESNR